MTTSLFCALVTISCWFILIEAADLEYGTISWRHLSINITSNSSVYEVSYCGGYPTSTFSPTLKLGDVLTFSQGVGKVTVASVLPTIDLDSTCNVTHLYTRGRFICCGVSSLSLSRNVEYKFSLTQIGGVGNNVASSILPANPTMSQSPRFINVAFQGLYYINDTLNKETPMQLPLASQETTDLVRCSTLQYEVLFKSGFNGGAAVISRLSRTPDPDSLFAALFTCRDVFGASADLLVSMMVPSDQTKINHPPQLSNTTQELFIITQSKLFLQQQNHSFVVGAFDVDGDPVDLVPSNVTWPTGATISRLFTPYVLPNRTITTCTNNTVNANVTEVICQNTTSPPEYSDSGIPRINTTSLFQIDWTPTPEQALADKTWNLCYRAQDTRGQVSLVETCLFLYVPRPCPAIPTPAANARVTLAYPHTPVPQSPNVTGSIATWTCDERSGIFTADGSTIIRESASQYNVQCLVSGRWNATTSVICRALCPSSQLTRILRHGSLSVTTYSMAPDVVNYTCHEGYIYQPNTSQRNYQCQPSGEFYIQEDPQCIPVPCPSLHIDQGNYTLDNGTDRTTANVTCNPGYSLTPSAPAVCSTQGTWLSIPSCIANPCQSLTLPPYALNLQVQNYTNGIATIECPINWNLQGNNHVTCKTDGSWEAWNVTCIPRCRVSDRLPTGPSGQVLNLPPDITYIDVGTTVRYGCSQSNLEYIGASQFTCTSQVTNSLGTFSGTSGICTAVCLRSELPSANNTKYYIASSILALNMTVGSEFSASKGPAGITVYSVCQAGSSEGVATYTCNNGAWSIPQACSVTCTLPDIPNINPASLLNSYPAPPYRYLIANQSITLSCASDYSFPGGNNIRVTCQLNGILSSSIPACTKITPTTCPAITLPPNVIPTSINATAINTNIDVSCATGYTLQGNITKVTCLDDYTWTSYQSIQCILDTNSNATAPTNPPPTCCENDTSLSTPAKIMIIIGIIIGVLIGIAVIIITVIMCRRKRAYVGRVSKMEGPYGEKSPASPAAAAGAGDIEFVDVVNGASAIQRSQAPEPILPPNVDDDYVHVDRSEAQHEHIQIDVMADEKSAEGAPRG